MHIYYLHWDGKRSHHSRNGDEDVGWSTNKLEGGNRSLSYIIIILWSKTPKKVNDQIYI